MDCRECFIFGANRLCKYNLGKCINFISKEYVDEMFEQEEERHRNDGGLVVCDHAEETKEYVVVKEISIKSLSLVDICLIDQALPIIRCICDYDPCRKVNIGHEINPEHQPHYFLIKHIKELEKLGFISEKVHDPVVNVKDWFYGPNGFYHIVNDVEDSYDFININGSEHYNIGCDGIDMKLSWFVGKDNLKDFKPVKVKIEVVE